jgi:hypothetical protein
MTAQRLVSGQLTTYCTLHVRLSKKAATTGLIGMPFMATVP